MGWGCYCIGVMEIKGVYIGKYSYPSPDFGLASVVPQVPFAFTTVPVEQGRMPASRRIRSFQEVAAVTVAVLLCLAPYCFASNNNSKTTAWVISRSSSSIPGTLFQKHQSKYWPRQCHQRTSKRLVTRKIMAVTTPASTPTLSSSNAVAITNADRRPSSTAIIGGGPTGLAVALMLARRGYQGITVLERLAEPPPPASPDWGNPERSYNLGIGGRGQVALAKLGVAEKVLSWCALVVVRLPYGTTYNNNNK